MYDEGIAKVGDVLDLAVEQDIVDKRGSFFSYGDHPAGPGRENAKTIFDGKPRDGLELKIKFAKITGCPCETLRPLPYPVKVEPNEKKARKKC